MDTRMLGLCAIIPATVLLTISFFVLYALRKVENGGLKVFGYVIAAFLWLSAALVFSGGIYTLSTGKHPIFSMLQEKARHHSSDWIGAGQMPEGMVQEQMPGLMQGKCTVMMEKKHAMKKEQCPMIMEKMHGMTEKEAAMMTEKMQGVTQEESSATNEKNQEAGGK